MKRKVLSAAFFLIFMIGISVFLTACGRNCFVGRRTAGVGFYRLDIECMNGTDWFTMELSAGDALEVQFETVRGSACMEIKEVNGNPLYTGNGRDVTAFTVNIPKNGTYSIYVEAHHAKGTLHIQRKMGKRCM